MSIESLNNAQTEDPESAESDLPELSEEVEARIHVRPFDFDFPVDLNPDWVPGNPYRAHIYNGVSLTMPYLEPFLCKTMREAIALVDDPQLQEDMRGFIGQEAQHYRCHRRLNALLTTNGYPGFAVIEEKIARSYERLSQRSLRRRLAYSAGFESMTNGFTALLVGKRQTMFANADPHIASFWIAHMVEETEHKTVAFDVYQYCFGDYLPRALGVLHGSFGVLGLGLRGMFHALRQDNRLWHWRDLVGLGRELGFTLREVGPFLLRAMKPSYDPREETEAAWVCEWTEGYRAAGPVEVMPLVDTSAAEMPQPFQPRVA